MKPFRLLTLAALAAATVPRLAHRGMFVDGVTYASIARNLAEGRGSFWSPAYTATVYPRFHEHPPLGFWLQSLWFRVFGDHLFVERLYALAAGLMTAAVIAAIWRRFQTDDGPAVHEAERHDISPASAGLDWLPVLLWIAVPVVSWALVGNLLETTVALFTTLAVAAAWKAAMSPGAPVSGASSRTAAAWSVLSGLCIVAAGLTKGPVGLFPLVAPIAFAWLPGGPPAWRARVIRAGAQWTTVGACALLLWSSSSGRASLTDYVTQQVLPAVSGEREVSGSSITIVKALVQGVMLPMAVAGLLAVAGAGRFVVPPTASRRRALVLFAIGLAATLPILASAKQAGHYLVPAVPLFALAAASMLWPTAGRAARRIDVDHRRLMNIVTALVVAGAAAAAVAPALGRDRERLANLDAIDSAVPRDEILGLCPESNGDWGLHAWFERRFRTSLDAGGSHRHWFLQTPADRPGCVPAECAAATDSRQTLVLMTCRRSD